MTSSAPTPGRATSWPHRRPHRRGPDRGAHRRAHRSDTAAGTGGRRPDRRRHGDVRRIVRSPPQHAAGGAVELVDRVLQGAAPAGFSVHRPPGHHATADRAMGFCLFNNIAIAARWALDRHGLERVMIVDFDVHHGNGTNDIFADDPRVLLCLDSPIAAVSRDGRGVRRRPRSRRGLQRQPAGRARRRRRDCSSAWCGAIAVPLAFAFAPQLLLISAGFDAHRR